VKVKHVEQRTDASPIGSSGLLIPSIYQAGDRRDVCWSVFSFPPAGKQKSINPLRHVAILSGIFVIAIIVMLYGFAMAM
jgi:hypothetical protein